MALLIASAVMGAVLAVRDMRDRADVSLTNAKARIESSVAESFKLLESLAEQPTLYERSVWVMDKVTMLDQVNEHFGYFLLCYVDDEMNVWDVTGSASLASRDFMQKCYSTGQGLVTDSFAAGADGVTLNYVVLVPLFDGGEMTDRCSSRCTSTIWCASSPRAPSAPMWDRCSSEAGARRCRPRRVSCTTTCSSTRFAAASRSV
ncbi:MAG: hypothetical protein ACLSVD_04630 [Eggerthellaceae bacterium]